MKNLVIALLGATIAVAACSNPPKAPVQGVTTTSAGVVSNADTAMRLSQAQCDRAKACNDFGTGKKYKDEAGCMSAVSHDMEDEYRPSNCPHGVREERLQSCINEMKNSACGNLADTIRRNEACRRSQLCIE